jgi:hypothetical protein
MTAKDFSFIAGVISNLPRENAVRQTAAQEFSDHLRIINPRFNERLFMDACYITQLVIPASRLRADDFICEWGEVAEVRFDADTILVALKGDEPGTITEFQRHDPVRIERLR